jgi:hypothetical protein
LVFQLRFYGALSEQEVILGMADITVVPNSEGIRPDGSSVGYVPGKTISAPTAAELALQPQTWKDAAIVRNNLILHSDTETGSGTISIELQYSGEIIQSDEVYNSVYKFFGIISPTGKAQFDTGFEWFNNSTTYEAPVTGNRVLLDVKPETKAVSCSACEKFRARR